jgi:hypothetical protein
LARRIAHRRLVKPNKIDQAIEGALPACRAILRSRLLDTVLSYPKLFADETPLPVLDPGRGKTKMCRFWVAAMDDRPWDGPAPPAVVYVFAEDRKGKRIGLFTSRSLQNYLSS